MNELSDNELDRPSDEPNKIVEGSGEATPDKCARKKRILTSISQRTAVNYILFTVTVLIMLWISFFIGLYSIYGAMLKGDVTDVGREAMAAFPKRSDDNSMNMFYKLRVNELARSNSAEIVVFAELDGKYDIRIIADAIEGEPDPDGDVFKAIVNCIDFDKTFTSNPSAGKATVDMGSYLYYGDSRVVENPDGGDELLYILVIKAYKIFNAQTTKIAITLIVGTVIVLIIASIFAFFASHYQTKQLKDFSQKAKQLAEGDNDVHFEGYGFDEFENLAGALNAAKDRAQKTEQLQRDLIANVTHDIRTPITMIRAYAEMLRDMPLDEKKRKSTAGVIISEADRLTKLVEDAMDFSRLQSGVAEFKFEQCDLAKLAQSTLTQFDIYRERNGFVFLSDIDKKAVVNCDSQKIERVLYNLLINAVNYCGDDKTVILRVKSNGEKVRVEVSDHGVGIAPEELDAVWDRYYRAARSKRSTVGSGLGLSICKNILDAHNAEFGVESVLGEGSTFWFELDAVKGKK